LEYKRKHGLGNGIVEPVSSVRDLGIHLDADRHIRSVLAEDIAKSIPVSLVSSRRDYCNSVLFGTSVSNLRKV